MTRINCIPPAELTQQHLIAEYRELPRVFTLAENYYKKHMSSTERQLAKEIPAFYTLGTGHVKFFYNKLEYLLTRFNILVAEMQARGYKPNLEIVDSVNNTTGKTPHYLWRNWVPTEEAMLINRARIAERLANKKLI